MTDKKKYFRVWDRAAELIELRDTSIERGMFPGFDALWEIFSLKKGYPLFVSGSPFSGKTEFVLELLIFTAEFYDWKHFVYLGETGSVDEIIAELSHKYIGKPYRKINKGEESFFAMDEKEVSKAHNFIHQHFVFLDLENDKSSVTQFTVEQFYKLAAEAEAEFDIKFDTTLIDPFNDVDENLEKYGGREDKFLKDALKFVRIDSKRNKRINILINHIADVKYMIDKDSGKRYTPPAMPNEWAGGRTWHRRAFTMLMVYRPPTFTKDETGRPYEKTETIIFNQKAKPKGSGKVGQCSLFWDWKKNRYYESINDKIFAHKIGEAKQNIQPYGTPLVENKKQSKQEYDSGAPF